MSKFDIHDLLRVVLIVLVSLLGLIARGIHTQQADVAMRLRIVEKNQVKIMAVMGIEPYTTKPQNPPFLAVFPQ